MTRALALLTTLWLAGCAGLLPPRPDPTPAPGARLLAEGDAMVRAGRYQEAREAYWGAATAGQFGGPETRGRALLSLGQVAVHPDNPQRDYAQAFQFLDQLIREYPDSPQADAARAWRSVLAELLVQQSDLALLRRQLDWLRRQASEAQAHLGRLRHDLDQLKLLDLQLDRRQRR